MFNAEPVPSDQSADSIVTRPGDRVENATGEICFLGEKCFWKRVFLEYKKEPGREYNQESSKQDNDLAEDYPNVITNFLFPGGIDAMLKKYPSGSLDSSIPMDNPEPVK